MAKFVKKILEVDYDSNLLIYLRTLSECYSHTLKLVETCHEYDVTELNFENLIESIFATPREKYNKIKKPVLILKSYIKNELTHLTEFYITEINLLKQVLK